MGVPSRSGSPQGRDDAIVGAAGDGVILLCPQSPQFCKLFTSSCSVRSVLTSLSFVHSFQGECLTRTTVRRSTVIFPTFYKRR